MVVIAAVGALGYGGYKLTQFAQTSEQFKIEEINVAGHVRATGSSVQRLSGLDVGANLFNVDLERAQRLVTAHPWVASAKVSRSYPDAIEIEVVEHQPVVLVALGSLYYANGQGDIVKRYTPGEKEALPIVTGLSREAIETDDGETRAQLRVAIDFLAEIESHLGESAPHITEVSMDPALGLSFTEAEADLDVVMGHPPYAETIRKFEQARDALAARGVKAKRLMLGGERRKERVVAQLPGPKEASTKNADSKKNSASNEAGASSEPSTRLAAAE